MTALTPADRAAVSRVMGLLAARDKWQAGDGPALANFLAQHVPGPERLWLSLDDIPIAGFGFACHELEGLLAIVEHLDGAAR